MTYHIISPTDYKVSEWSGGKTTEVFLSPSDGAYRVGEFDFRLSTADVQLEHSTFSALPGYNRIIMSLDNDLSLTHIGDSKREVYLKAFETNFFKGEDATTSVGTCQDFNLIFRPELTGNMQALFERQTYKIQSKMSCFFYALADVSLELVSDMSSETLSLTSGECLIVEDPTLDVELRIVGEENKTTPPIIAVSVQ